jgi:hypothetical protein
MLLKLMECIKMRFKLNRQEKPVKRTSLVWSFAREEIFLILSKKQVLSLRILQGTTLDSLLVE